MARGFHGAGAGTGQLIGHVVCAYERCRSPRVDLDVRAASDRPVEEWPAQYGQLSAAALPGGWYTIIGRYGDGEEKRLELCSARCLRLVAQQIEKGTV